MVYVDSEFIPYGRMLMCHMLADTTEELVAMAEKIGVSKRWIQYPGTYKEHFDICKAKRDTAIQHGAKVIGRAEVCDILAAKKIKP